jgi:hypothetical protein
MAGITERILTYFFVVLVSPFLLSIIGLAEKRY